jgi:hypothetical protein
MGLAHYIVLEKEIDGLDTKMDGKRLSQHIDTLDQTARRLGVHPLSEFFSMPPEDLAEFIYGADEIDLSLMQHYCAHDGLATVRALLSRPEAQPAIDDLRTCERILNVAARHGIRWHFQIDAYGVRRRALGR